jgi:hypothetical protein
MVLECPGCGLRHAVRHHCGHRACGRCQEIQRHRKVQDLWPLAQTFKAPRFLTLTFKSRSRLTRDWRRWQAACLRKFFKNKEIAAKLGGGIWAWEITYNQRLKMWHPHFHILFDGQYIPKALVKKIWSGIAEGAFIVDVRPVVGVGDVARRGALRETVKYITKGIDFVDDEELLTQFLVATKGMRRIGVFGNRYGYKAPKPPATDKTRWIIDPFTGGGPRKIECECGHKALPQFFRRIGGYGVLFNEEQAAWLASIRGEPDPVLWWEREEKKRAERELTFEEVFR